MRFDEKIYSRAMSAIAHGALTNSKRAESFVKGVYPTHVEKSQGGYSWDTHGNKYIDFITALGANLLGAAEDSVNDAILQQLKKGVSHSLGTPLEVEVAERLKGYFPFVEKMRFLKTGSEACSAALRIARVYRDRHIVLSEGYHGWHDEFTSLTPPANGAYIHRKWIRTLQHIDLQMDDLSGPIAAVIVEPIVTDMSPSRIEYLRKLREICTKKEIVLIFDETITGLRFTQYSVSNAYGIFPDLIIAGKALANGLPLAFVGGKRQLMETDYFVSSTFAGETLSLAACKKVLELLQNKYQIDYLWEKGKLFLSQFNAIWPDGLELQGYPTRSRFIGEEETKALFMQEACKAGILIGPSFFFNFPHIEMMDEALSTFRDILSRIKLGQVSLEGEMPIQPFSLKVRNQDE